MLKLSELYVESGDNELCVDQAFRSPTVVYPAVDQSIELPGNDRLFVVKAKGPSQGQT